MKTSLLLILLLLLVSEAVTAQGSKLKLTIGALLDTPESVMVFNEAVRSKPNFVAVDNVTIEFEGIGKTMKKDSDTMETAHQVCELIESAMQGLVTLILGHPRDHPEVPPLAASFTASYYQIPTISISARHTTFSDKNSHPTFIRTVPPYNQEALVVAELIRHFDWKEISVIRTMDEEGKMFLYRLERASADETVFKIKKRINLPSKEEDRHLNCTNELLDIAEEQSRVVVLYADREAAGHVFREAKRLGLLDKGWSWLVSEEALRATTLYPGIFGVQLSGALNHQKHIKDAVSIAKRGIQNGVKSYLSENRMALPRFFPRDCSHRTENYRILKNIFDEMNRLNLMALTGNISFDRRGDREQADYSLINVQTRPKLGRIWLRSVGNYHVRSYERRLGKTFLDPETIKELSLNMSQVFWPPGNFQRPVKVSKCVERSNSECTRYEEKIEYKAPISYKQRTLLRVVTVESVPFVYKRSLAANDSCNESDTKELNREVPCNHTDPKTRNVTQYCCFGYNIDLLRLLANRSRSGKGVTPFSYKLHLVGDNRVGERQADGRWNGIVQELISDMADLAVAPLTITPERAMEIDFTKPFKYLGLTILIKREMPKSNLVSFLQPFHYTLWLLVFLSVHVVALVLYLLDRFSPFGRFKLASSSDTEEDALNLASAMWFAWGVLLNSGIGEGTPRSFSARVLGMVWAGFAMIIVASYTANLAAFLVLDRPEAIISGIDDARMRNPTKDFLFATVTATPVEDYFKKRLEYATMFRTMEQHKYHSIETAIDAVRSGKLKAFIWDSARLNFEASAQCELMTAGEVFGRFDYGLAMQKGSPWLREMSQAVLNFHERGVMAQLDTEWILAKAAGCPPTDSLSPATLGLTNMAGVFIMVAVGIVAGVFLIFIEMAYKKRTGMKEKELELAKSVADRWRGNIEKRKVLRRGRAASHFGEITPSNGGRGHVLCPPGTLTEADNAHVKRSLP